MMDLDHKVISEIEEALRHLPIRGKDGDRLDIGIIYHSGRWRLCDLEPTPKFNVNGETAELA